MIKRRIFRYLKRQSFQPTIISIFFNPLYFIRKNLYVNLKQIIPSLHGTLLDFGCGRKPYETLFNVEKYIGVDIKVSGHDHLNSKVDVFYDGKNIPFGESHFDSIFCGEVLEHVFNPDEILCELNRVLKIDGLLLLTVPFCWNEHEVPYDYGRYSSYGIRHLLEKNKFYVVSSVKSGNFIRVIFQLMALYVFEGFKKHGKLGYAFSMLIIAPINILGIIISPLFPVNSSLFFNNIILAKKLL